MNRRENIIWGQIASKVAQGILDDPLCPDDGEKLDVKIMTYNSVPGNKVDVDISCNTCKKKYRVLINLDLII